jgi:hypothetical protein
MRWSPSCRDHSSNIALAQDETGFHRVGQYGQESRIPRNPARASTYVVMAKFSASNFSGQLSHTDALYFTVTVFSTVGFGDIAARTEAARLVVTTQMIADIVILGIAAKTIVGAAQRARRDQPVQPSGDSDG